MLLTCSQSSVISSSYCKPIYIRCEKYEIWRMLDSVFYNYCCFEGFNINPFALMVNSNVAFSVDLGSL